LGERKKEKRISTEGTEKAEGTKKEAARPRRRRWFHAGAGVRVGICSRRLRGLVLHELDGGVMSGS